MQKHFFIFLILRIGFIFVIDDSLRFAHYRVWAANSPQMALLNCCWERFIMGICCVILQNYRIFIHNYRFYPYRFCSNGICRLCSLLTDKPETDRYAIFQKKYPFSHFPRLFLIAAIFYPLNPAKANRSAIRTYRRIFRLYTPIWFQSAALPDTEALGAGRFPASRACLRAPLQSVCLIYPT